MEGGIFFDQAVFPGDKIDLPFRQFRRDTKAQAELDCFELCKKSRTPICKIWQVEYQSVFSHEKPEPPWKCSLFSMDMIGANRLENLVNLEHALVARMPGHMEVCKVRNGEAVCDYQERPDTKLCLTCEHTKPKTMLIGKYSKIVWTTDYPGFRQCWAACKKQRCTVFSIAKVYSEKLSKPGAATNKQTSSLLEDGEQSPEEESLLEQTTSILLNEADAELAPVQPKARLKAKYQCRIFIPSSKAEAPQLGPSDYFAVTLLMPCLVLMKPAKERCPGLNAPVSLKPEALKPIAAKLPLKVKEAKERKRIAQEAAKCQFVGPAYALQDM